MLSTSVQAISVSSGNVTTVIVIGVIAALSLGLSWYLRREVLRFNEGTPKMQEIAGAIQEGASAYLRRQFRTLAVFAVIVFALLFLLPGDMDVRIGRSGFFLLGAACSAIIGYMGMWLAVRANVRVAYASTEPEGRARGARIAFRTGGAVGMGVVGQGLGAAALVVFLYRADAPAVLEGFGFGAALLAMFMRVGGGIFTKAADVGADLVGKVENHIPEDDPRNAATIADNVGDNVGDCAGMAADLFESYAVTLVAALILGKVAFGEEGLIFPLIVTAIGAFTAAIGVFITKVRKGESGLTAINRGFYTSAIIGAVLAVVAGFVYLPVHVRRFHGSSLADLDRDPRIVASIAVLVGILLAGVILWLTGYFTDTAKRPTRRVARTSLTGAATVVLAGIGLGLSSAVYTALVIAGSIVALFFVAGSSIPLALFLVALAGCGLLTTVGVIVAMDTFGPVSDNAQGIAEMSGEVDEEAAKILTDLDAVGNTTKAITKGIAIATAVLAATALFGSYSDAVATAIAKAGASIDDFSYAIINPHHARWRDHRWLHGVPVLGSRDRRGDSRRGRHRVRGAPPVPRDARHHGRHPASRVRPRGGHLHARLAARTDHPRSARGHRAHHRGHGARPGRARGLPRGRYRHGRADGRVPRQLRWLVGQREEDRRGRPLRRQELARLTRPSSSVTPLVTRSRTPPAPRSTRSSR